MMDAASKRSATSESRSRCEIGRCEQEIVAIEALLIDGHGDVEGLCLALSDWSAELRLLQDEKRRRG